MLQTVGAQSLRKEQTKRQPISGILGWVQWGEMIEEGVLKKAQRQTPALEKEVRNVPRSMRSSRGQKVCSTIADSAQPFFEKGKARRGGERWTSAREKKCWKKPRPGE